MVESVTRLVTTVELTRDGSDDRRLEVAARLEAVLADGRSVLLLDDRGWSESGPSGWAAAVSVQDIEETARTVVGPDEPFGDHTAADMAADHWGRLARDLRRAGVRVTAHELASVPHDVVLGAGLRAVLSSGGSGPSAGQAPT